MSKLKKLLCAMFAMVMVLAMSTSAFAATITIDDGDVTGATYVAYKLMDVTVGTTKDDSGNDVNTYSYTVNSKYSSILQSVTNQTSDAAVITYLQGLTSYSESLNTVAENIYAEIKKAGLDADATAKNNTFTSVALGYYLIVETATGSLPSGTTDTFSIYMLDTAGSETTTVFTKESVPTLVKKVQETDDSTYSATEGAWQDAADYDIGDEVPFQLTGTVSSEYANYDTYYYAFHDKLSVGLTFTSSSVKVYVKNGTTKTQLSNTDYTVRTTEMSPATTDGCSFEVIINDLKSLSTSVTVNANSTIIVEYTAKLNDQAAIGSAGNPNEARLEYANNPYGDGTGYTPWDKVTVFTYQLEVDKYSSSGDTLNGAGFTLYKYYATGINTGDWRAVEIDDQGNTEQVYTNGYVFNWAGLDAGNYKLVETTVPAGYTKADDITFTVSATYQTSSDNPTFTDLSVNITSGSNSVKNSSITKDTGKILIQVINKSGSLLPTTGGIGTTIFYIVGTVLVLGAAVLLITRRRMGKEL